MNLTTEAPTATAAEATGAPSRRASVLATLRDRLPATAGAPPPVLLVALIFSIGADQFLTADNLTLILDQTAPVTIAAGAMTMGILIGGVGLSVGAIPSLSRGLAAGGVGARGRAR